MSTTISPQKKLIELGATELLKEIIHGGFAQFKKLWHVLLLAYIPILLLYILLGVVSRSSDTIHLSYFVHDVIAIGQLPFYAGMVSQLGLIFWAATVTVCLFTIILLSRKDQSRGAKQFLTHSAILTTALLLDDTFMFHEDILPGYFNIGEKYIYILYFLFFILILWRNRKEILTSEYLFLGFALVIFAASTAVDAVDLDRFEKYGRVFSTSFQNFMEDGLKFVGIVTWLVYFMRYAIQKLKAYGIQAN